MPETMGRGSAGSRDGGLFGLPSAKKAKNEEALAAAVAVPSEDVDETTEQLAQLTLSVAQTANLARSALNEVYIVPMDSPLYKATKEASSAFHEEVMATPQAQRKALGPPYIRVFQALLAHANELASKITEPDLKSQATKAFQDFLEDVHNAGDGDKKLLFLGDVVRTCRVTKCRSDPSKALMEVIVSTKRSVFSNRNSIEDCWYFAQRIIIETYKAERQIGTRPMGGIERKLMKKFAVKRSNAMED
eukprot:TRINITY_DN21734_c0_g4_i1.p2 TRINITY_DN21734_c0_g4~~TRINITY_DN21734_c0_g4_i1.p2  ORF type:complete len:247 (+),score=73.94 TRINITY_DN21734_c0_g4_i1:188-928(+)